MNTMTKGILLIVEDEADLSEILVEMLAPLCAEIYTCPHGKEALEILKQNKGIHAVLSDINMPQMTGFQLLAHLRAMGSFIPFVTLTAYGDQENMRESIRLNATDFLTKPFERKELTEVVTKALIYGMQLEQIQNEIAAVYSQAGVPQEMIEKLKELGKKTIAIRIENSKYSKNNIAK